MHNSVWKTWNQESARECATTRSPTEHYHPSQQGCWSYRYSSALVGLPWELPWASGSQRADRGEAWHGWRTCAGCRGAEGPWSSSLDPPCALDPADGQTPAALGAGPVTSGPVEGGNYGGACRGQAGPGEHWGPQPTQGQREEGVVKQTRLNNTLVCICTASGIFLSHPESVSSMRYCGGVQYDDWVRGKPEILLLWICYCSLNEGERCIYVSGRLCNMKELSINAELSSTF